MSSNYRLLCEASGDYFGFDPYSGYELPPEFQDPVAARNAAAMAEVGPTIKKANVMRFGDADPSFGTRMKTYGKEALDATKGGLKSARDATVNAGKKAYTAGKNFLYRNEDIEKLRQIAKDPNHAAHFEVENNLGPDGLAALEKKLVNAKKAGAIAGGAIGGLGGGAIGAWAGNKLLGKGEVRAAIKSAIISSKSPSDAAAKLSGINSKKAHAYAELIKKNADDPNWKSKTLRKMAMNKALALGGGGLVGAGVGGALGTKYGALGAEKYAARGINWDA